MTCYFGYLRMILFGWFTIDPDLPPLARWGWLLSRFTWESMQNSLGFTAAFLVWLTGRVAGVSYIRGITLIRTKGAWGAFSLGAFIIGDENIRPDIRQPFFLHEYGHSLQSRATGILYLFKYGIPSLISASRDRKNHRFSACEQDANHRSNSFFQTTKLEPAQPDKPAWYEYVPPVYPVGTLIINVVKGIW